MIDKFLAIMWQCRSIEFHRYLLKCKAAHVWYQHTVAVEQAYTFRIGEWHKSRVVKMKKQAFVSCENSFSNTSRLFMTPDLLCFVFDKAVHSGTRCEVSSNSWYWSVEQRVEWEKNLILHCSCIEEFLLQYCTQIHLIWLQLHKSWTPL